MIVGPPLILHRHHSQICLISIILNRGVFIIVFCFIPNPICAIQSIKWIHWIDRYYYYFSGHKIQYLSNHVPPFHWLSSPLIVLFWDLPRFCLSIKIGFTLWYVLSIFFLSLISSQSKLDLSPPPPNRLWILPGPTPVTWLGRAWAGCSKIQQKPSRWYVWACFRSQHYVVSSWL